MKKDKPGLQYNDRKYVCYLDLAMSFIRAKWKAVILCHLKSTPKRFLELQRILPGVSQKILNEQLKQLEEDGIIHKEVFPEIPPKVEFSLTERGAAVIPALEILEQWAKEQFSTDVIANNKKEDDK